MDRSSNSSVSRRNRRRNRGNRNPPKEDSGPSPGHICRGNDGGDPTSDNISQGSGDATKSSGVTWSSIAADADALNGAPDESDDDTPILPKIDVEIKARRLIAEAIEGRDDRRSRRYYSDWRDAYDDYLWVLFEGVNSQINLYKVRLDIELDFEDFAYFAYCSSSGYISPYV